MTRDATSTLRALAKEAAACRRCDLWRDATQVVFGSGPVGASMMLIGEQPGDQEDRAGEPFVGPAGRELDDALADAGIERADVYLTNAVKHFKWTARGKRRIHQQPNRGEVLACRDWLGGELAAVRPSVVVTLGATAGQALFGASFRVGTARGAVLDHEGIPVVATIHPSAIVRLRDPVEQTSAHDGLVADLRRAATIRS